MSVQMRYRTTGSRVALLILMIAAGVLWAMQIMKSDFSSLVVAQDEVKNKQPQNLSQADAELFDLSKKKNELLLTRGSDHPEVRRLQQQIGWVQKWIDDHQEAKRNLASGAVDNSSSEYAQKEAELQSLQL